MGRQLASYDDISYTYDENGMRASKTVNGKTTKYYYDGNRLMHIGNGSRSVTLIYDRFDEAIGFFYCGQIFYYVKNLQGDITALISDEGFLMAKYVYDDWGNCTVITSNGTSLNDVANVNPIRYRGYVYDNDTGLYYLQSRYYDPEVGRFINCDDVNYIGLTESEVSYNPFAYCENNPINNADPTGCFVIYYDYASQMRRANEHLVYNYLTVLQDFSKKFTGLGYIYGQSIGCVAKLKYGCKTLSYNGCEIIAMYNALIKIKKPKPIYKIIYDAETRGGLWLDGLFGTFPNYIGSYFKSLGIKTKSYYTAKSLDKNKKKGDIFIVVYNHTVAMLHAVMVEVNSKNNISVYNDNDYAKNVITYTSFSDMISKSGNFIVIAYKVG